MARPFILDQKLMSKIASKRGKQEISSIRNIVSKKAAKLGISSEAALILLAKEHGIGTSIYQRKLDATKQTEVRDALPSLISQSISPAKGSNHSTRTKPSNGAKQAISKKASLRLTIEYLIEDQQLRSRCQDILMASANFDRPISQATLVLEDRIREKAQLKANLVGESLVGHAFKEDISKTVLRVASESAEEQRGFTQILRGVVSAFRNKTHHHIVNSFSREEAMRVCGFIDVLLRVVDNSVKVK